MVQRGPMMRTALLLSSLFVAACTVGEPPKGASGTDAGTAGGDGATGNGCVDRLALPDPAHVHLAGGGTNAGQGCVVAGCHLASAPGTNAPGYQFAGTIYKPGGTTPNAGVTVTVKSMTTNMTTAAITDDAGNFSISAGSLMMAFPATVNASACPTLTPMVSQLSQGGGNCTSAACHGGTTAAVTLADQ